jgi:uncharacterized membrane protein YhhN
MNAFRLPNIVLTSKLPSSPYPEVLSALVGLIILSEALNFHRGGVVFKVLASLSLFGVGVRTASSKFDLLRLDAILARQNRFDVFLILGLALSYIGDVILVGSDSQQRRHKSPDAHSRLKIAKLFHSFTHIAYILAFTAIDLLSKEQFRRADFAMTIVFGWLLVDWLGLLQKERQFNSLFEVPQEMQWPVILYSSITVLMVATATATDPGFQRILGAWLFMSSDLCMAFNAFGVGDVEQTKKDQVSGDGKKLSGWVIASLGWICYYLSQLFLVGCV